MVERLKAIPVVFTALQRDNQVLLLRRFNTGYMDGRYDFPSGHLDVPNEPLSYAAIRELKEETGIDAIAKDLELFHIYQNCNDLDNLYLGFMYRTFKWQGEPAIQEPHKCNE